MTPKATIEIEEDENGTVRVKASFSPPLEKDEEPPETHMLAVILMEFVTKMTGEPAQAFGGHSEH